MVDDGTVIHGSSAELNTLEKTKSLYLIDASIYIFQAYFSPHTECVNSNGEDLSAVFGYTQFLFQFLRRTKPQYVAVARDESLQKGFRHRLYNDYKSNRELPDDNLKIQLNGCAEIAKCLGLADFASEEYEADDIIGTLCKRAQNWLSDDCQVTVVSRDKDLAQLLFDRRFELWDFSANKKRYAVDIFSEYGVKPEQFPDYLGLIGDSVDMIKGVPGVGPVKAKALLQQYQSIEHIYENLGELHQLPIRGAKSLGKALQPHKQLAELSKLLATIVCNVDSKNEIFSQASLEDLKVGNIDEPRFTQTLKALKFDNAMTARMSSQLARLSEVIQ